MEINTRGRFVFAVSRRGGSPSRRLLFFLPFFSFSFPFFFFFYVNTVDYKSLSFRNNNDSLL